MKINTEHLKRYKEILQLVWKYGRSDLVQQMKIDEELADDDKRVAGQGQVHPEQLADDLEAMGPWIIAMAIGFEPGAATLPVETCSPPADERAPATGSPLEWPLPPMCGQEFEGACVSSDGKVRITVRFEGRRRQKQVPAGFYGGEGHMKDMFYTGTRTLTIEDVASRRVATFVERLHDSRGYIAPGNNLRYIPDRKRIVVLDIGEEKRPPRSFCIKLP